MITALRYDSTANPMTKNGAGCKPVKVGLAEIFLRRA
jgi:hypothetical protein